MYIVTTYTFMTEKDFFNSIDRFLTGKATPKDISILKKFENFAEAKNKDKAFSNTSEKEKKKKQIYDNIKKQIGFHRRYIRRISIVAASLLILLGASFLIIYQSHTNQPQTILVQNNEGKPKQITLPDLSKVTLNNNSSLSYTTDYNKTKRNITLMGEAIFSVTPNQYKPFVIKTGKLMTQVVGTTFSIKEKGATINVSVIEGQVKVFHCQDTLYLKHSERAVFNQHSTELKEEAVNTEILNLWAKKTIVLNNISYKDLSEVFADLYNYTIQFENNKTAETRLSVAFENSEKIEDIIQRVNMINKIKLTLKPNNMIIAR